MKLDHAGNSSTLMDALGLAACRCMLDQDFTILSANHHFYQLIGSNGNEGPESVSSFLHQ